MCQTPAMQMLEILNKLITRVNWCPIRKQLRNFPKCNLYSTDFYCGGQLWRFAGGTDCIFKRIQWIPSAQCFQNKQWRSFCFENTPRSFSINQKVIFSWHYNFVYKLNQRYIRCNVFSFINNKLANGPENIDAANKKLINPYNK